MNVSDKIKSIKIKDKFTNKKTKTKKPKEKVKEFFEKWILRQHFKDAVKYRITHFMKKNPRKEYLKKLKVKN